jgi:hypothetical protein
MAAKGKKRSAGKKTSRRKGRSFGRAFLALLFMSWFGRVFLISLVAAAVIGLDLLVSGDRYEIFFLILGLELVATALFFWLRLIWRKA